MALGRRVLLVLGNGFTNNGTGLKCLAGLSPDALIFVVDPAYAGVPEREAVRLVQKKLRNASLVRAYDELRVVPSTADDFMRQLATRLDLNLRARPRCPDAQWKTGTKGCSFKPLEKSTAEHNKASSFPEPMGPNQSHLS